MPAKRTREVLHTAPGGWSVGPLTQWHRSEKPSTQNAAERLVGEVDRACVRRRVRSRDAARVVARIRSPANPLAHPVRASARACFEPSVRAHCPRRYSGPPLFASPLAPLSAPISAPFFALRPAKIACRAKHPNRHSEAPANLAKRKHRAPRSPDDRLAPRTHFAVGGMLPAPALAVQTDLRPVTAPFGSPRTRAPTPSRTAPPCTAALRAACAGPRPRQSAVPRNAVR